MRVRIPSASLVIVMSKIDVEYDGRYPVTCMGTLVIKVDDEKVYEKQYCCHSSGSVWFDGDWNEHVESGTLSWEEHEVIEFRKWFDEHYAEKGWKPSLLTAIEEMVGDRLAECSVCCGGCV